MTLFSSQPFLKIGKILRYDWFSIKLKLVSLITISLGISIGVSFDSLRFLVMYEI